MTFNAQHEHPGGDVPHRHSETDELATHDSASTQGRSGDQTLELRQEELQARKESVEAGRVRIGKEIVEERQTLDVPVTREEVTIERHPVNRQPAAGSIGDDTTTIEVPLREERVEIEKQPVVTEEISVGKRLVQETQEVSGTVRREEARLEREGDVNLDADDRR